MSSITNWFIIESVVVSSWSFIIGLFIGLLVGKYLNSQEIKKEETIKNENEILKITIHRLELELRQMKKKA